MIAELLLRTTARSSPALRRLGLAGDAVALWSRATRHANAWRPHEERCHAIVRRSIAGLEQRRTVLVLGAGLGRDVPLPVLAETFERVVLIDAVHLLPARQHAKRAGAYLAVADLTGLADWFAGGSAGRGDPLAPWRDDPSIDLVVSANVLSQLPMAIESWLERHPRRAQKFPPGLADAVTAWHLADLASLTARVCLLSDTSYRVIGRDGGVREEVDLLRGAVLPGPDESWDWIVAPFGEIAADEMHVHRVHGYTDLRLS